MSGRDTPSPAALGFLTVIESEQHGLVGGYLVLNLAGRPLEFHCTAPVKPNRAQQILYGPTLEPYLYGEQIGQSLLAKSPTRPLCICTDRQPVLALRDFVSQPVAWVAPCEQAEPVCPGPENSNQPGPIARIDGAHRLRAPLELLNVGPNRIGVAAGRKADLELLRQRLAVLDCSFDLLEPFGRIREAIFEAQRGSG